MLPYRLGQFQFKLLYMALIVLGLSACGGVPIIDNGDRTDNSALSAQRVTILHTARTMLGVPYRSGGATPKGFDCSGLTFYSYQQAHIDIPRTSLPQYRQSKPVSLDNLQAGDLVFFRTQGRAVSHVGIYQGHDKFVHAASTGDKVSVESMHHPYWRKRFVRGGRFL